MNEYNKKINFDRIEKLKHPFRRNRYRLDLRFVIRDGKRHRCALIIPGGGYSEVCSYVEGTPFAKKLNENGISAVILNYRVGKKAHYPNPQDDVARAVRELFKRQEELNLDMTDYSVWGSSAGGHLAGSFGTALMGYRKYELPSPGSIVLIYPVISLEKNITHPGTRNNLIGVNASAEDEKRYSIYTNVDRSYPGTFIWCGTEDTTVPPLNTRLMVQALKKHNIEYVYRCYEGLGHGIGLGKSSIAEGWIEEAIDFMLGKREK